MIHVASLQFLLLITFHSIVFDLNDGPSRFQSCLNKGDAFYHAFDNAQALEEYKRVYDLAPDSLSILLRLVRTYNDIGRIKLDKDTSSQTYYEIAVRHALTMARLYPDRAESHFWLALTKGSLIPFRGVGDKIRIGKEVQDEAMKALELDSTFSYAYVILAIFQREGAKLSWFEKTFVRVVFGRTLTGSFQESEKLLDLALKFDPRNSYALYEMYYTCRDAGKTDKALRSLRNLENLPPTNAREQQQRVDAAEILRTIESAKPE